MPVVTRAQKKMDEMDNMTDAQLVRLLVAEKLAVEAVVTVKQSNEENKFLNEKLDWAREALEEQMDFREENKQLKEENKKLKNTIVSLKSSVDDLRDARDMRDHQIKELIEENKQLKEELEDASRHAEIWSSVEAEDSYNELREENKKLKELTDGIMDEKGTGHILGCNAYEKFCQAICELNHDEKWITELKEENEKLKNELINQEQVLYKKLYEQEQEYNKTATEYHALLITHKELLDEKINHYKK